MRNLKKILALVLALMMALSVMVFASADYEDYTDTDEVNPQYEEAVRVLVGMGVIVGRGNMEIQPKGNVERSEVATLVYRVMSKDLNGSQVNIYEDYGYFDDVKETNWFAGYVNFAANSDWVVGKGDNKFDPDGYVTGYELITILLRLIGYDANDEISGSEWKITAAKTAKSAGILGAFNEAGLNEALTREQVAYLLFNALQASKVWYTPALSYLSTGDTIGFDNFNLIEDTTVRYNTWGQPSHGWIYNVGVGLRSTYIAYDPVFEFNTPTTECNVVIGMGEDSDVYVNGQITENGYISKAVSAAAAQDRLIDASETVATMGAQGRLTQVYSYVDPNGISRVDVAMRDQFLAQVTDVKAATFDDAGHLKTPSSITLNIIDTSSNPALTTAVVKSVVLTGGEVNFSYAKNDMVLVYAATGNGDSVIPSSHATLDPTVVIIGKANATTAAQTAYDLVAETATIGNTSYKWAEQYHLGNHGTNNTTYVVYTDTYGNLIGLAIPATVYNYGVISKMAWVNSYQPLVPSYAAADLMMMNGTPVKSAVMYGTTAGTFSGVAAPALGVYADRKVSTDVANNLEYYKNLYQYTVNADGKYVITAVGTELTAQTIQTNVTNTWGTAATNDYTVYLVETLDASGNSVYNSYTGYKTVPSMGNVDVSYMVGTDGHYVTYAYVDATAATYAGETLVTWIGDDTVDAVIGSNNAYYTNGAGSTLLTVAGGQTLAAVGFGGSDVYEVTRNLAGEVTGVTKYFTKYTADGTKAQTFTSVTGCTGTSITDGTNSFNCTGATVYEINGATVTPSTYADVVGNNAWCVVVNGVITEIYHD